MSMLQVVFPAYKRGTLDLPQKSLQSTYLGFSLTSLESPTLLVQRGKLLLRHI